MKPSSLMILFVLLLQTAGHGQKAPFSIKSFFIQDSLLSFQLRADFKAIQRNRFSNDFLPGTIQLKSGNDTVLKAPVMLRARGEMRRERCYPPPIMIDFKTNDSNALRKLGRLKMVTACADDPYSNQILIREYLVYRLYQLFTPLSFGVRLVSMDYEDLNKTNFSDPRFAFFLEDVDDMAKRNDYRETDMKYSTPSTDRNANTIFAMFQYMIGNTDWAIPLTRNLKLVYPKAQPNAPPVPVPYDFDYSGLVNASYAVPFEELPISNVRERYYMGFERTEKEIMEAIELFRKKKEPMYEIIRNCQYLREENKRDMVNYLEGFFKMINNELDVKETFIINARKQ